MAQINKPSEHFNTKLYTGNGTSGSTQAITGVGFQPDLVWIKSRTTTARHALQDVIRGTGDHKLSSNEAQYEGYDENDWAGGYISSFDNDGFTANGGTSNASIVNNSGTNYASWNWKANGTGSANTDGSINSTVSANTTSGFSIVSYTGNGSAGGATVGHGLGTVPKMYIVKNRSTAKDWTVYHNSISAENYLELNQTIASTDSSSVFNDTEPTSSVFSLGNNGQVNTSGDNYIAYCFAEKTGYSKFGSYKGNGNTDGTFVYTGFKPAFVMVKNTTNITDWWMKDSKRPGYNQVNDLLYPNLSNAEEHGGDIDIVSNGFKVRTTATNTNENGNIIIYMAFAEAPLVGTNGVTAKAR